MTAKMLDFWSGMPTVIRTSLVAILGSVATILAIKAETAIHPVKANETYWNESDIRKIFREEMTPLKVGFLESIKSRSDKEQLRIISAMARAEERLKNKGAE